MNIAGSYGVSGRHLFTLMLQINCNWHGDKLFFNLDENCQGFVEIRRIWLYDLSYKQNQSQQLYRHTCIINGGNF